MKSKILLSLFGGLTTGFLIGLLFAPEKGSKLRKKALKKGGKYSKVLMDKIDEFHDSVPDTSKFSNRKIKELASKAKKARTSE